MKKVKFKDLNVGDIFFIDGIEYKKAEEKKISCCKRLNATLVSDDKQYIQVKPLVEVDVND